MNSNTKSRRGETPVPPLGMISDLYVRRAGRVYGPIQVRPKARQITVLTASLDSFIFPMTDAGLEQATAVALKGARVGREWSGAIDKLLSCPAVSRVAGGAELVR